jgi:hypothetical protein
MMEYNDDQNTNKGASEKHVISAAIVDALGGASLADRQRQVLVEELKGPGGAAEPVNRERVGLERGETDAAI